MHLPIPSPVSAACSFRCNRYDYETIVDLRIARERADRVLRASLKVRRKLAVIGRPRT
ncbi:Hypothetical protein CBG11505 [Anopheles sinensis]|uniref:Uncharacterized protein n=1 Tax=Anopheles sinensis TaxID=74873 RepID=A0A084WJH4_ANOSI|nr:Hypothetical protein CBG11505 [Anopheles sinensis]